MPTITLTEKLTVMQCGECGVNFAMPESMRAECKRDGGSWYCPNGHSRIYTETWKDKFEKERAAKERAEQRARANRDLLVAEERSHAATRGHLTRTKKRVANGVCPCCHRSFVNLRRHMDGKHPEYANPTQVAQTA